MESNWVAEHLQTIRTLMERSALYRRALAPIMIWNGAIGTAGAAIGWGVKIGWSTKAGSVRGFILYWAALAVLALTGSFLLVRRQALRADEPFWSLPTQRVTQAFLPGLFAGFSAGLVVFIVANSVPTDVAPLLGLFWLPLVWVVAYGCALNAAGFFMPRGIRLFAWVMIVGGCGSALLGAPNCPEGACAHAVMGSFFGLLHLAYGVYLYFTEKRRDAA